MATALLISIDIGLRNWLSISLPGTDELAGYALAISAAWALSFTLMERAHIRIDSFYILLPRSIQVSLDLLAVFLILIFFGFITYHAWIILEQSIEVQLILSLSSPFHWRYRKASGSPGSSSCLWPARPFWPQRRGVILPATIAPRKISSAQKRSMKKSPKKPKPSM